MTISGSIHVAASGVISFFFYSIVYMYHIFFIHSSVDGHLGWFHVLAIVNSAAMNIGGACVFSNYGFLQVYLALILVMSKTVSFSHSFLPASMHAFIYRSWPFRLRPGFWGHSTDWTQRLWLLAPYRTQHRLGPGDHSEQDLFRCVYCMPIRQVVDLLWASVSSCIKWEQYRLPHEIIVRIKKTKCVPG